MLHDNARELKARVLKELIHPLAHPRTSGTRTKSVRLAESARTHKRRKDHIRTIAIGLSKHRGTSVKLAVRIQRAALVDHAVIDRIRRMAKGEVDIQFVGRIRALAGGAAQLQECVRPLRPGISIGHQSVTTGTLGCFVLDSSSRQCILSNNHVLAWENNASDGDPILQPSRANGGTAGRATVAELTDFVKLNLNGANEVDCAIAEVESGVDIDPTPMHGVPTMTSVTAESDVTTTAVQKVGSATDVTTGRISATELDNIVISYEMGSLRFDGQVEIQGDDGPFSDGGDSGSVIVTDAGLGVALLCGGADSGGAGGQGVSYANYLERVMKALSLTPLQ